ncbi:MAG: hypothetical protein WC878_05495 [Candidatus Paceibacterota bacterium]|jgi:hypothetical protein
MKNKKILKSILVISVVVFVVAFIPMFPDIFGLCKNFQDVIINGRSYGCEGWYTYFYGNFMFYPILLSPIVFLFSILVLIKIKSEDIFRSWKNFSYWWIPISIFFIAMTPSSSGGSLGSFGMGMDRESVTWFFAVLFFLISLILIIYKSIKLKGK